MEDLSFNGIPMTVILTLAQVRDTGKTNMFNRITVSELAANYDAHAANWIADNKGLYVEALTAMGEYVHQNPDWKTKIATYQIEAGRTFHVAYQHSYDMVKSIEDGDCPRYMTLDEAIVAFRELIGGTTYIGNFIWKTWEGTRMCIERESDAADPKLSPVAFEAEWLKQWIFFNLSEESYIAELTVPQYKILLQALRDGSVIATHLDADARENLPTEYQARRLVDGLMLEYKRGDTLRSEYTLTPFGMRMVALKADALYRKAIASKDSFIGSLMPDAGGFDD